MPLHDAQPVDRWFADTFGVDVDAVWDAGVHVHRRRFALWARSFADVANARTQNMWSVAHGAFSQLSGHIRSCPGSRRTPCTENR
jgi:hypothetical protein